MAGADKARTQTSDPHAPRSPPSDPARGDAVGLRSFRAKGAVPVQQPREQAGYSTRIPT